MSTLPRRPFPHPSWAWPEGRRHLLITAAICPDRVRALEAISNWLDTTSLDDTVFSEHRLLAAITSRFDAELRVRPEYPRLQGMQRLNWTRSRLASATAVPALAQMVAQGIEPVLLKGAGRVAMDVAEQKSRTAYDIDVLVCEEDFAAAFEILAAGQWLSTRGESAMGLRARLSTVRARNFKKGHFGDIDLHRSPYHFGQADPLLDAVLFIEATSANYYGVAVRVPAVEERLCLALAHGGRDAGGHSDWLVDMARMIESESIDWDKVVRIARQRRIVGVACVVLSYLADGLALPIPASAMKQLAPHPRWTGLLHPMAFLIAKDNARFSRVAGWVSALSNGWDRSKHSGRSASLDTPRLIALTRRRARVTGARLEQPLETVPALAAGHYRIDLTLALEGLSRIRRVDLELNSQVRNLAHFRAFNFWTSRDGLTVRFRGVIRLAADDYLLTLHALPGKLLDETASVSTMEMYAPVPFCVVALVLKPDRLPLRSGTWLRLPA